MSAVCGVLFEDGRPDAEHVAAAMLARMRRRGAHGPTVWAGEAMALAGAALHTGRPVSIAVRGPLVVAADARLDNANALSDALGEPPADAAALVAAAVERWGDRAVDHLRGDYGLAVIDTDARTATLVRDRFGIRPLHYVHLLGRAFAFASTLEALVALPGFERTLDEWQLGAHLADVFDDPSRTIYVGARKVPQSAVARYSRGAVTVSTYYTLRSEAAEDQPRAAWVEGFRERFTDAVRVRLDGAVRPASQLSGGLDSTAVTVVARDVRHQGGHESLRTYSLVFPSAPEADERSYIDAVIAQGSLEPTVLRGDAISPLENLRDVYTVVDDMIVAGNQHALWLLFQQAQADGVDVLLDGLDGDHAVEHGYRHLEDLARAGDWRQFRTEAHALVARFGATDQAHSFETDARSVDQLFRRYGFPVLAAFARERRLVRAVRGAEGAHRSLGASRRTLARTLVRSLRRPPATGLPEQTEQMLTVLDPEFIARTHLRERLDERFRAQPPRPMRDQQAEDLLNGKMALALSGLDQVTAAFGIELRHPFMDQALLEYALSLPPALSLHDGWTRAVLREAIGPDMPVAIRDRIGKADASGVLGRAFVSKDSARIEQALGSGGALGPYLDAEALKALRRDAALAAVTSHDSARVAATLLATASIWLDVKFQPARPAR